jgi:hypothetical protein
MLTNCATTPAACEQRVAHTFKLHTPIFFSTFPEVFGHVRLKISATEAAERFHEPGNTERCPRHSTLASVAPSGPSCRRTPLILNVIAQPVKIPRKP